MNDNREQFFSLQEYISEIKLSTRVLEHLEETNESFYQYLKKLTSYNKYSVIYFWMDSLFKELEHSSLIEHELPPKKILEKDAFFDKLQISHARIHQLHDLLLGDENENIKSYRTKDVKIAGVDDEKEIIYRLPPKAEIVQPFMNDFLEVYKMNNNLTLHNNPFIKSALVHFLFVQIHPYMDGNGRTARMIHNIKFTELVNKMYDTKLKLCPLNISQNINMNKISYCSKLDDISFKPNNGDNEKINKWFDFLLNMADEQLYFVQNRIDAYGPILSNIAEKNLMQSEDSDFSKKVDKMKIKTIL